MHEITLKRALVAPAVNEPVGFISDEGATTFMLPYVIWEMMGKPELIGVKVDVIK